MKFADDNQLTVKDLSFSSDDEIEKLDENITKLQVCGSRRNSLEKSLQSNKGNGKCGRPANPVPRHKRDSHIKAEHKRRDKIQKGFDTLREMVPALENCSAKESKSSMLFKTAEHCRQLKVDCKAQQDEALALRHEIESLGNQIHMLQGRLPAVGIKVVEKSGNDMNILYSKYIKQKTKESWRFWMFSLLVKPLFDTYRNAMEGVTSEVFADTVGKWAEENLSLVNLRPAALAALRKICTRTKIMDKPEELQKDVMEQIALIDDENGNNETKNDAELATAYRSTVDNNATVGFQTRNITTYPQITESGASVPKEDVCPMSKSCLNMHSNLAVSDSYLKLSSGTALPNHETTMNVEHKDILDDIHDIPMTSVDMWDMSSTLPAIDSSSSISDMIFTASEDSNLYDSLLNSLCNTDSMHGIFSSSQDQMNVHPVPDLSNLHGDYFTTCTTCTTVTTTSQNYPLTATGHDCMHQHVAMVTNPSFSDLEMLSPTMESSVDPVVYLSELDTKNQSHNFVHDRDLFSSL